MAGGNKKGKGVGKASAGGKKKKTTATTTTTTTTATTTTTTTTVTTKTTAAGGATAPQGQAQVPPPSGETGKEPVAGPSKTGQQPARGRHPNLPPMPPMPQPSVRPATASTMTGVYTTQTTNVMQVIAENPPISHLVSNQSCVATCTDRRDISGRWNIRPSQVPTGIRRGHGPDGTRADCTREV